MHCSKIMGSLAVPWGIKGMLMLVNGHILASYSCPGRIIVLSQLAYLCLAF